MNKIWKKRHSVSSWILDVSPNALKKLEKIKNNHSISLWNGMVKVVIKSPMCTIMQIDTLSTWIKGHALTGSGI